MVKAPIWKDTLYTVSASGTLSAFEYHIELDGNTIFQGKAYPAPQATTLEININRVCENYLSNELQTSGRTIPTGTQSATKAYREFKLYNANNSLLETYQFLYDWEYDYDYDMTSTSLSRPVNGHFGTNMLNISTNFNGSSVTNTVTGATANACGNYALYYLNRAGGWDSFLIEGLGRKKDVYEKYYTNSAFNNNTLAFEQRAYHNQITTEYELHTGWLTDEESQTLAYHLLASNRVYLHDLCSGDIVPVILTDTEASYKTYKGEGRKMASYTINVAESQLKQNI